MGKFIDLTGQKFGRLTVLEKDTERSKNTTYWKCICECGKEFSTRGTSLRNGKTISCGCARIEKVKESLTIDLTGQTFGNLTVIKQVQTEGKGAHWLCACNCGNTAIIDGGKLRAGVVKSCGCLSGKMRSESLCKKLEGLTFGKWRVIERDLNLTGDGARWICQCQCGQIRSVAASSLISGRSLSCGCLHSAGEYKISCLLNKNNIRYEKEYIFPDLVGNKLPLRFDFAIKNDDDEVICLVEFQGEQHYKYSDYFEKKQSFEDRQRYDQMKRDYCQRKNLLLIEVPYWDYEKLNDDYVKEWLKSR